MTNTLPEVAELCRDVIAEVEKAVVGKHTELTKIMAAVLAPGGHVLLANGAGIYGPLADVTYSGGLAADGGSLALRDAGGAVLDAVAIPAPRTATQPRSPVTESEHGSHGP